MNIQAFLVAILAFLNKSILPLLFTLAFFFFLWNAVRYFIIGGANEESQEKAKTLATWGIAAFVFLASLWGIVNLVIYSFGVTNNTPLLPDYMQQSARKQNQVTTQNFPTPSTTEPPAQNETIAIPKQDVPPTSNTETWTVSTISSTQNEEVLKELGITGEGIVLTSIEESSLGKTRISLMNTKTLEPITITKNETSDGIVLVMQSGDKIVTSVVTVDENGEAKVTRHSNIAGAGKNETETFLFTIDPQTIEDIYGVVSE